MGKLYGEVRWQVIVPVDVGQHRTRYPRIVYFGNYLVSGNCGGTFPLEFFYFIAEKEPKFFGVRLLFGFYPGFHSLRYPAISFAHLTIGNRLTILFQRFVQHCGFQRTRASRNASRRKGGGKTVERGR